MLGYVQFVVYLCYPCKNSPDGRTLRQHGAWAYEMQKVWYVYENPHLVHERLPVVQLLPMKPHSLRLHTKENSFSDTDTLGKKGNFSGCFFLISPNTVGPGCIHQLLAQLHSISKHLQLLCSQQLPQQLQCNNLWKDTSGTTPHPDGSGNMVSRKQSGRLPASMGVFFSHWSGWAPLQHAYSVAVKIGELWKKLLFFFRNALMWYLFADNYLRVESTLVEEDHDEARLNNWNTHPM